MTVFSGVSIKVAAESVPSGGHYLTVQETRHFIGDRIPFTYFNGSQYVDSEAVYQGSVTSGSEVSESPVGFVSGATYLKYSVSAPGVNTSSSYITFHMQPSYSIYDTEWLYTCFALVKLTAVDVSSAAYQSPNSDWYIAGSQMNFANHSETSSGSGAYAYLNFGTLKALYIPIVHRSQSTFSAYSIDADFNGVGAAATEFYVMCPYVSGDAFGQSGTFASSSTPATGTTPVYGSVVIPDINIDMDETNSILSDILQSIGNIGSVIVSIFSPSEQQVIDFHDDLIDLLEDTFGGQAETADALDDVKAAISDSEPVDTLYFPAISVMGFTIPEQSVNLVPLPELLPYIKLGFDFLATILFINVIRLKIDEIIHGKIVVESDEVDSA